MGAEKKIFDVAIQRAEHSCYLYGLVHQVGSVKASANVVKEYKNYIKFRKIDKLLTIKGKGANGEESLLLIKNPSTSRQNFEHEYASELLRSTIVSAVAALDKYMHEITVNKCFILLRGPENKIPSKLLKLEISAHAAFKAANTLRTVSTARPGNTLKKLVQSKLHSQTMQGSGQIDVCLKLMGVNNFWQSVATKMGAGFTAQKVQKQLNGIVGRRNEIVHEADFVRELRARNRGLQEINWKDAEKAIKFITNFVAEADTLF